MKSFKRIVTCLFVVFMVYLLASVCPSVEAATATQQIPKNIPVKPNTVPIVAGLDYDWLFIVPVELHNIPTRFKTLAIHVYVWDKSDKGFAAGLVKFDVTGDLVQTFEVKVKNSQPSMSPNMGVKYSVALLAVRENGDLDFSNPLALVADQNKPLRLRIEGPL